MAKRSRAAAPLDGFSIRAVTRMTSVEPDTLRMWERRYGFPKPSRTAGGSRVYSAADVEALRLIARAQQAGFRAGEVVGRSPAELLSMLEATGHGAPELALHPAPAPSRQETGAVDVLLDALARGDVAFLRKELRKLALELGPVAFVTKVAAPLATRLGELWEASVLDIHHEHLMTELITTQLRLLLSASEDLGADKSVLLATPVAELHGLGIEMVAVYLAFHQVQPRLLGVDAPADQIVRAARSLRVDAVGLTVSEAADLDRARAEVERVARGLPAGCPLWLGGAGRVAARGANIRRIDTWSALDAAIRDLRAPSERLTPASSRR